MAASCSSCVNGGRLSISPQFRNHFNFKGGSFSPTESLSFNSCLSLSSPVLLPKLQIKGLRKRNSHALRLPVIVSAQSNFFRAIQTAFKVGKDGIEAGTNLVPDAIPRPIARISVAVVATSLALFVLRSFLSTVFFTLSVMGLVYFVYLALNKDKGPLDEDRRSSSNPASTDEAIEEAKRIMDKYK